MITRHPFPVAPEKAWRWFINAVRAMRTVEEAARLYQLILEASATYWDDRNLNSFLAAARDTFTIRNGVVIDNLPHLKQRLIALAQLHLRPNRLEARLRPYARYVALGARQASAVMTPEVLAKIMPHIDAIEEFGRGLARWLAQGGTRATSRAANQRAATAIESLKRLAQTYRTHPDAPVLNKAIQIAESALQRAQASQALTERDRALLNTFARAMLDATARLRGGK